MGNTHGKEPWVKKPWVYTTFLVVPTKLNNNTKTQAQRNHSSKPTTYNFGYQIRSLKTKASKPNKLVLKQYLAEKGTYFHRRKFATTNRATTKMQVK
jgi:hypothetical protein